MTDYDAESEIMKALGEPQRLKILDLLSCGEMCACKLLECLSISQSTLSHHMKVLMDCGLVAGRKDATWMHYTICRDRVEKLQSFINYLIRPKESCICDPYRGGCNGEGE